MATPLVSGAAALVWTMSPAATYQQVAGLLKDTTDKVGTNPVTGQTIPYVNGRNDYFGYGRLNVGQAVRQAYPPSLTPVTDVQQFLLGGSVTQQERQVTLVNPSGQELYWQATVIQGAGWLGVDPAIGTAKYGSPGTLTLRASRGVLSPGIYTGKVRVQPLYVTGIPSLRHPGGVTCQRHPAPHLLARRLPGLVTRPVVRSSGRGQLGRGAAEPGGQSGAAGVLAFHCAVLRRDIQDNVGVGQRPGVLRPVRSGGNPASRRLPGDGRRAEQRDLRVGPGLAARPGRSGLRPAAGQPARSW